MFGRGIALFRRLYSLTYHWTQMKDAPPTDDEETIKSLETHGRGGSNPLEDLTLADSMLAEIHENRTQAKEYLERRFGGFAVKTARKMGLRVLPNLNECEWWLNAYYSLVGLMGNAPALASYAGRAGVGTWIKMVVYSSNRANPRRKRSAKPLPTKKNFNTLSPTFRRRTSAQRRTCEAHEFNDSLRSVLARTLPDREGATLYWNEKTPKRFIRVVNAGDYDDAWTISPKDVREACKLCGSVSSRRSSCCARRAAQGFYDNSTSNRWTRRLCPFILESTCRTRTNSRLPRKSLPQTATSFGTDFSSANLPTDC